MSILYYCEDDTNGAILKALRERLPTHNIEAWPECENPQAITKAIVWQPPADFFNNLSSLKQVLSIAAGVDHLLDHPGLPNDVSIIRLTDAGMAEPMADFVLYGTLHAQRRMTDIAIAQRNASWQHELKPLGKSRLKVGILGAGEMGRVAAHKLLSNGYSVACWSRSPKPASELTHYSGNDGLDILLSTSNVLVCLLPLTPNTKHIINTTSLSKLPKNAFLINAGRGGHVDEQALLDMLNNGHLSGALLDVFESEPLPASSPFWGHEKVLVTPHVAAPTDIEGAIEQIAQSIELLDNKQTPPGTVDRTVGY